MPTVTERRWSPASFREQVSDLSAWHPPAEAVELRKAGITGEILILGYTHPRQFSLLRHFHLTQTVLDHDYAELLNRSGRKIDVHIKIDTGMHRLGNDASISII